MSLEPAPEHEGPPPPDPRIAIVARAISETREFKAGMAFGVPVSARPSFAEALAKAAVDALGTGLKLPDPPYRCFVDSLLGHVLEPCTMVHPHIPLGASLAAYGMRRL